jgi:PKD repeat protein
MVRQWRFPIVVLGAALAVAACTANKTETPALSGPSEFALALSLSANPDILRQDGSSQSQLVILARDANGQPVRNVPVHLDVTVDGKFVDFGALSSRDVTTGSDGRATLAYTSPAGGTGLVAGGTVTVLATPTGADYKNAVPRSVDIRLVPVVPPGSDPIAQFTFSPAAPNAGTPVSFDASTSAAERTIVSCGWAFGDGATATGVIVQHPFTTGGTFTVALTVTDDRGRTGRVAHDVTVTAAGAPTAAFTKSPSAPTTFQNVYFNGSASTAGAGHTLVDHAWDFGAGGAVQHGINVSTVYNAVGTYTVTLVVTDNLGQTAQKSDTVAITAGGPTANFNVSPTSPVPGDSVQFDGTPSTCPSCTIVTYAWEWGDGGYGGYGQRVSHAYTRPGSYQAQLTVTDNAGHTATATKPVVVTTGTPTALFEASVSGVTVVFDASTSVPSTGQTITSYEWVFGDTTTVVSTPNRTISHDYPNPGVNPGPPPTGRTASYTVTLTVVDTSGGRKSTSKTVTITGF